MKDVPTVVAAPQRAHQPPQSGQPSRGPAKGAPIPATHLPVARVAVDVALAHLDRIYDYLLPEALSTQAVPGARVRVRFAGRLVDGFVIDRQAVSEHVGALGWVERVVSAEPVLNDELFTLCRTVADRWAGTLADVLRLAVPPRHAGGERGAPLAGSQSSTVNAAASSAEADAGPWLDYPTGPGFLQSLAAGGSPRAVWATLPGPDWPAAIAHAVGACLASGRGAIVVAPDGHDVARLDASLTALLSSPDHGSRHVTLTADLGPQERYRRWLAVRRGVVSAVVGSRSAAFAPVANLGLVVCWDDGDDLHDEPRAPYPNARDVLVLRAHSTGAGALIGGFAPSVEALSLVAGGWGKPLSARRDTVRVRAPRVEAVGSDTDLARDPAARAARLPTSAWTALRAGLATGAPVLVQVPRRGYQPALSCDGCRRTARCGHCAGPLGRQGEDPAAACRACGKVAAGWTCPTCSGAGLRAVIVGAGRTAEELGRSFPGVAIRTSGREGVLAHIDAKPAIVVATPGAEPVAEGGYAAVLLLDGWVALSRPDLRAAEETLRRWCSAAALARSATDGGRVVVMADAGLPVVQALVRWDPTGFGQRESAERAALALPPVVRLAAIEGEPEAVAGLLAALVLPHGAQVLGPVPVAAHRRTEVAPNPLEARAIVRIPRAGGQELANALKAAQSVRSARKERGMVRVRMDARDVL